MKLRRYLPDWNRSFALLACAVFSVGMFFGVQLTLFNNFIVERFHIEAHDLGFVEALRELPGFLNAALIALLMGFASSLVGAFSLVIMGAGLMAYAFIDGVPGLVVFSLVWSLGFHCWAPLSQSMALAFSPEGAKGKWLGQLHSTGSAAWLAAIVLCLLLYPYLEYEGLFAAAGAVTIGGGLALLFIPRKTPVLGEPRFLLRRHYGLYYALNFLQGWRKQMFITFAIFTLVKVHRMPVETTMVLVFINQTLVTFTAPLMGRLIDRHGERRMLGISYGMLIFIWTGYAVITWRPALYVLYCVDNLVFFGGIALTTYLHKIAPPAELKPALSMGVTFNHMSAVAGPLIAGYAWMFFGYKVIFYGGAALAFISLLVSRGVKTERIRR